MKIAVIGTGISGNVAAYTLNQAHDIKVFDANDHVGGHTHTHDVELAGRNYAVDTGFIVYNEATYPNFIGLLDKLGVNSKPTTMSFSVKNELTGLEYNGHTLNTLFAQRSNVFNLSFHRMIRDILRFNRDAPRSLDQGDADMELGDFLRQGGYSQYFIDQYIIPMGAAIWSTDPEQMQSFPARFFIQFFLNHGLLQIKDRPQWRVIQGGSREYVKKLTHSFADRIRLNTPVDWIRRFPTHVDIKPKGGAVESFDAIFIATHSDQALAMLQDPSATEQEILGAMKYQPNEAVLHTDSRMLPSRKLAWASWNYHVPTTPRERVAVTYNMNILQGIEAPKQFCVTLNNSSAVNEKEIIKRVSYDHPVFTRDSLAAQQRHSEIDGVNRTYYCGAYWRNGFHEDGVVSALEAVKHFEERNHEELYLQRAG